MNTLIPKGIASLCWNDILGAYSDFKQSRFNPNTFELKYVADIWVMGNQIDIHPADEQTISNVVPILSRAVSSYYNAGATVTVENTKAGKVVAVRLLFQEEK